MFNALIWKTTRTSHGNYRAFLMQYLKLVFMIIMRWQVRGKGQVPILLMEGDLSFTREGRGDTRLFLWTGRYLHSIPIILSMRLMHWLEMLNTGHVNPVSGFYQGFKSE
jgi:hypothetical protein